MLKPPLRAVTWTPALAFKPRANRYYHPDLWTLSTMKPEGESQMADLSVDFAGLKLKNPFVIASSELTNKLEKIKIAEENGASAVSTKLAFLKVPLYARPYHIIERDGAFYSPSGERMTVEDAQELIQQCKEQTDLKVIANMMGPGEDLEGWAELGRMLEEAGADMLELNMSCPNLGLMAKQMGIDEEPELGASLGKDPVLAGVVCKAVVDAVKIPVMAKMTPEANTMMVSKSVEKQRGGCSIGHQLPAVTAAARHRSRWPAVLPVHREPVVRRPLRPLDTASRLPARGPDPHRLPRPADCRRRRAHELAPLGRDDHVRRHCAHLLLAALSQGLEGLREDRARHAQVHGRARLRDSGRYARHRAQVHRHPWRGRLHPDAAGVRPGEVQRLRVVRGARALRVHRDHRQEGRHGEAGRVLLLRGLLLPVHRAMPSP